jgi:hypothetical protein
LQLIVLAFFAEHLKAEPHQWGLLSPWLNLFCSPNFPTNIENLTSRNVEILLYSLYSKYWNKWQDNFLVCKLCNCMLSPADFFLLEMK